MQSSDEPIPFDLLSGIPPLRPSPYTLDRPGRFAAALTEVNDHPETTEQIAQITNRLGQLPDSLDPKTVLINAQDEIWQQVAVTPFLDAVSAVHGVLAATIARDLATRRDELRNLVERHKKVTQALLSLQPRLGDLDAIRATYEEQETWSRRHLPESAAPPSPLSRMKSLSASARRRVSRSYTVDNSENRERLASGLREQVTQLAAAIPAVQTELLKDSRLKAESESPFQVALAELATASDTVNRSLRLLMLGRVRQAIADQIGNDAAPEMTLRGDRPVLASDLDRSPYLTSSYSDIELLIATRAGGSIGVSGPRGAGKTTLIRHVCGTRGPATSGERSSSTGPSRLGLVLAAPVTYEPRDFIVHLHRELCAAILGHGGLYRPPIPSGGSSWLLPITSRAILVIAVILGSAGATLLATLTGSISRPGQLLLLVGVLLAIIGCVVAVLLSPQSIIGVPLHRSGEYEYTIVTAQRYRIVRSILTIPSALAGSAAAVGAVLEISAVGFAVATPMLLGTFFMLCAASGISVSQQIHARRRLELEESVLRQRSRMQTRAPSLADPRIISATRQYLDELRYDVSYSAEASATLKAGSVPTIPVGAESKLGRGISWAPLARTFPQIVENLRRHLAEVGEHLTVVVGIDELDKMRSAEDVERFLNEIKSVFGPHGTFFLVSVSEDAAAGFDRRGTPFRDVFDSSFNEIVVLGHLTFEESRRLIVKEFGLWTTPFVFLCHVLSGGLPRDLLRVARAVVSLSIEQQDGRLNISRTALLLISDDLGRRVNAVRHELRKHVDHAIGRDLYALLAPLAQPAPCTNSADTAVRLQAQGVSILQWVAKVEGSLANRPPDNQIIRLAREIAANLLLDAALLEFLSENYLPTRMRAEEGAGGLVQKLPEVRRLLAVEPDLALTLLRSTSQSEVGAIRAWLITWYREGERRVRRQGREA